MFAKLTQTRLSVRVMLALLLLSTLAFLNSCTATWRNWPHATSSITKAAIWTASPRWVKTF